MYSVGDKVRVVKSCFDGHIVGTTGEVVAVKGNPGFNAFVSIEGYSPDGVDQLLAEMFGLPVGSRPFRDEELELINED